MKRKVLSDFVKKTLYVSLICASLCGAVAPSQVQAAINTAPTITSLAKELDKTVGINEQIPTPDAYKVQKDVLLFVEGNLVQTPNGIINYKDSIFIPIAIVSDALGAEVGWDGNLKIAQVTLNGTTVEILNRTDVGIVTKDGKSVQKKITVTGSDESLPALNINGTTYLPTRFVSESLGLSIKWHNSHPETGQKTITIGKHEGLNYKKPEAPKSNYDHLNKIPGKDDGGNLIHYNPINPDWDAFFSQVNEGSGAKAVQGQFYINRGSICAMFDHNGDGYIGDPSTKYYAKISELGKIDREELLKYQGAENNYYANKKHLTPKPTKPGSYDGQVSADGVWTFWTDTNEWEPNGDNQARKDTLQSLRRNNPIKTTIS